MTANTRLRRQLTPAHLAAGLTPRRALVVLGLLGALGLALLGLSALAGLPAPAPPTAQPTPPAQAAAPLPPAVLPPARAPVTPGRPTATPAPGRPTPTRTPLALQPGDLNILLLGCDAPNPGGDWRTDTIVIVAIRPRAGFVAMFSVPRDLYVDIPGYGPSRINAADYRGEVTGWPGGGPGLVADTLMANLGIPVHAYVRVDFQGLVRIIDTLGGITVDVDRTIYNTGSGAVYFAPGAQRMDGATALQYVRLRTGTNENDLGRTRRQQQVLLAMRDAALRPAMLLRLPALIDALSDAVDTDLTPAQVLSLVNLARRLPAGAYRTRTFDTTMVSDWVTPSGGQVLRYDRARVEDAWAELTRP
ncbi:MAG: LCP family protein [Candidatus Methylomirabilales bacterium]